MGLSALHRQTAARQRLAALVQNVERPREGVSVELALDFQLQLVRPVVQADVESPVTRSQELGSAVSLPKPAAAERPFAVVVQVKEQRKMLAGQIQDHVPVTGG